MERIGPGSLVTVELEIRDDDGDPVVVEEESPLRYRQGAGEMLAGVEEALAGAAAGDELTVTLAPEDAFGPHDPEGLFVVPAADLPDELELVPGAEVTIVVRGGDDGEEGEDVEIETLIVDVTDEGVVLDANHPLAGRTLTVRVRVLTVEPPAS